VILGIDISNYNGVPSPEQLQSWKGQGVQHVVVRASLERQQLEDTAHQQLQVCRDAGFQVAAYVWAYFSEDPKDTAQAALDLYDQFSPDTYWLDCEETDPQWAGSSPGQRQQWLGACVSAFEDAGKRVGVYTGSWWWVPYMDNSPLFADLPLWDADYDGVADDNDWSHYGGWSERAGKQYSGNPIDLDVWHEEYLNGGNDNVSVDEQLSYWGGFSHDVLPELIDRLQRAKASRNWSEVQSVTTELEKYVSA
jgi:hypothetical protein